MIKRYGHTTIEGETMSEKIHAQTMILRVPSGHSHTSWIGECLQTHGSSFGKVNPAITDDNFQNKSVPMRAGETLLAVLHPVEHYAMIQEDLLPPKTVRYGIHGLLLYWAQQPQSFMPQCQGIIAFGLEPWIDGTGAPREPLIKMPWGKTKDEKPILKPELALWHIEQEIPKGYWILSFIGDR